MLSFFGEPRIEKKLSAINHRLHRGERGKRRRTREKPPPSPPHPFLTRKKVLGKKKIEKSQSSLSMLGFQRKKTFFFSPIPKNFGINNKKAHFQN